jgi:hypothetical protein
MIQAKYAFIFYCCLNLSAAFLKLSRFPASNVRNIPLGVSLERPIDVETAKQSVLKPANANKLKESFRNTIKIYREDVDFEEPDEEGLGTAVKQPLLFLPGLDGVGNYSAGSVRKLNVFFDVWKMSISGEDRSSFLEIASVVIDRLNEFDQPVILVGESFGGLLASYVALRAGSKIDKLVLINPATSFEYVYSHCVHPLHK